jgi:hypothetical protein
VLEKRQRNYFGVSVRLFSDYSWWNDGRMLQTRKTFEKVKTLVLPQTRFIYRQTGAEEGSEYSLYILPRGKTNAELIVDEVWKYKEADCRKISADM